MAEDTALSAECVCHFHPGLICPVHDAAATAPAQGERDHIGDATQMVASSSPPPSAELREAAQFVLDQLEGQSGFNAVDCAQRLSVALATGEATGGWRSIAGWRLVPVVATTGMIAAAGALPFGESNAEDDAETYRVMVEAAPTPPREEGDTSGGRE